LLLNDIPEYKSLSRKHQAFIKAYLDNNGNATQAYKEAYNLNAKDSVAGSCSSKLLINPKIKEALEAITKRIAEANTITLEWVEGKIQTIIDKGSDASKLSALNLICRIRGWLNDRPQANIALFSDKLGEQLISRLDNFNRRISVDRAIGTGDAQAGHMSQVIDVEGLMESAPPAQREGQDPPTAS
jgi:hypothetical protein